MLVLLLFAAVVGFAAPFVVNVELVVVLSVAAGADVGVAADGCVFPLPADLTLLVVWGLAVFEIIAVLPAML